MNIFLHVFHADTLFSQDIQPITRNAYTKDNCQFYHRIILRHCSITEIEPHDRENQSKNCIIKKKKKQLKTCDTYKLCIVSTYIYGSISKSREREKNSFRDRRAEIKFIKTKYLYFYYQILVDFMIDQVMIIIN